MVPAPWLERLAAASATRPSPSARALATALTCAFAAATACSGDAQGTETDGGGNMMEPVEERPTPKFVNPATKNIDLLTHEHEDLQVEVQDIVLGNTELWLDGRSLGAPNHANPRVTLTEDMLHLHNRGALVEGLHELMLVTEGTEGTLQSNPVTLTIKASDLDEPVATASELELDLAPGLFVRALASAGGGERGLLLALLEPEDDAPTLRVYRAWDADAHLDAPLPGYVWEDSSLAPGVTAVWLGGDEDATVRVAWRVGAPGTAIATLDVPWGQAPDLEAIRVVAELPPPAPDAPEWAAYGRPALMFDTLVAELLAPTDVETPHPGDRRLVKVHWPAAVLEAPAAAQPLSPAQVYDLDTPGPVLDVSKAGAKHGESLALRGAGVRPALLRRTGPASVLLEVGYQETSTGVGASLPASISAVLGAFGSQTVATVDADGALALSYQNSSSPHDDIADVTWVAAALQGDDPEHDMKLPKQAAPTGALAPALLLGTPVFLVPYGADISLHAVMATGEQALVNRLDGVRCDAVATPLDVAGNEEGAQRFACLQGGVLSLGEVRLTRSLR